MPPYPLRFEPILKAKVWGGRSLEQFHKRLPPAAAIGESWEIADLDATSPSGGGGDAAHSVILNGPLKGRTIRDAVATWGNALLGGVQPEPGGAFPLLVKLLDAQEHLSVQVHPSPRYAAHHPDAKLKTESWLVLDAQPGAVIYRGVKPGVTQAALREAIERGSVPDLLHPVPVRPGDCHHLPSGTLHALGAGVVVAEVQTPSDTTFRVYDWGRRGRELHVEQALACADLSTGGAGAVRHDAPGLATLVETPAYTLRQANLAPGDPLVIATRAHAQAIVAVRADVGLTTDAGTIALRCGQTALVPAGLESFTLVARSHEAAALIAQVGG